MHSARLNSDWWKGRTEARFGSRICPCVTSSRPGGWQLHKAMSGQQQDGPALARLGIQRAAAKISLFFKPPVKASAEPSPAAELSVTREPSLSCLPHPAQPALTGSPGSPSSTPLAGEPEPCPQVESRLHRHSCFRAGRPSKPTVDHRTPSDCLVSTKTACSPGRRHEHGAFEAQLNLCPYQPKPRAFDRSPRQRLAT